MICIKKDQSHKQAIVHNSAARNKEKLYVIPALHHSSPARRPLGVYLKTSRDELAHAKREDIFEVDMSNPKPEHITGGLCGAAHTG